MIKDDFRCWWITRGRRPFTKLFISLVRNRQLTWAIKKVGHPRKFTFETEDIGWFLSIHLGNYFFSIDWA